MRKITINEFMGIVANWLDIPIQDIAHDIDKFLIKRRTKREMHYSKYLSESELKSLKKIFIKKCDDELRIDFFEKQLIDYQKKEEKIKQPYEKRGGSS